MSNRTGSRITYTGALVVTSCGVCSIRFAMPEDLERRAREQGKAFDGFYCPQGHTLIYRDGENDRLKRELASAESRNTHLGDQLHASIEEAEKIRLQVLKDRHRIANGVCPCCQRSFENVRRHVQGQHPEYDLMALPDRVGFPCECGRSFESLRGLRTHQGHMRADDWWKRKSGWMYGGRHLTKV